MHRCDIAMKFSGEARAFHHMYLGYIMGLAFLVCSYKVAGHKMRHGKSSKCNAQLHLIMALK